MALDRIIKIKHTLGSTTTLGGLTMDNNTWYDIVDEAGRLAAINDSHVKEYIYSGYVTIHNGNIELVDQAAYEWISTREKKDIDGRDLGHDTPRYLGTYTYFTGVSDDQTDEMSYGWDGSASPLIITHNTGDSTTQSMYLDLNTIVNPTYIREGCVHPIDAAYDTVSLEVVPKTTTYTSGSNTNYDLYGGYLIIPADGDGTISVSSEDIKLVQVVENEFGEYTAGYWDADFNTTTKAFENITPNANGTGGYNMFGTEVVLHRFCENVVLYGSASLPFKTEDVARVGHNTRMKITARTRGTDHDWSMAATLMLYRQKTI